MGTKVLTDLPRKAAGALRSVPAVFAFWCLAVAMLAVPEIELKYLIAERLSPLQNIVFAGILLLPWLFAGPRWRWTILLPVWLLPAFIATCIWSFRFSGDFQPLANYLLIGNLDSVLIGSLATLVRPHDIVLFLSPAITTAVWCRYRRRIVKSHPGRPAAVAIASVCTLSIIAFTVKELSNHIEDNHGWADVAYDYFIKPRESRYQIFLHGGLPLYLSKELTLEIYIANRNREASPDDIDKMSQFRAAHRALLAPPPVMGPKPQNLILIIVESLNSWAIDYEIGGRRVMPVLSGLLRQRGTLSALGMVSQVRSGTSSDGQLCYNTGFYPASDCTSAAYYHSNRYHGLAHLFRGNSLESICEPRFMWQHDLTNVAFGYGGIYDYVDATGLGNDEAMFRRSLPLIDSLAATGRQFMAELVTLSMHVPYNDDQVEKPAWITDGTEKGNYLAMANYFDACLGRFLDKLKTKSYHKNTLIAIASDHSSPVAGCRPTADDRDSIAFVALGTPYTRRIYHPVGQVDVYPTILDLLGRSYPDGYRGMGLSMLNPRLTGAIDAKGNIVGNTSEQLRQMLLQTAEATNTFLRTNTIP